MDYSEALGRWGAKIAGLDPEIHEQITVDLVMNQGYACCGGRDPDCYCSFAESASMELTVSRGRKIVYTNTYFDFSTAVREILEVADGKH